ncbi:DUF4258 domain-containing protein [Burkholderia gladioli]|uniref:DUF4258 domain-containing protein n=1 Tax=Burkholderia gladioli TaxID=28095 RepID=UPI000FD8BB55|nr:DUF4258 domain-containing protein [Burkholderia gladioli]MBU9426665.1 DUF4258 domain-containing protein [Burkholderia gladioli]MDN8063372.1 DUF4258 domain-containing protein [Burkholderia gladioli]QPQ83178.1 DUF4258 domain-containing protein [Burkholderia gladioli]
MAGTTKQIADAIGAETGSDLLGKLAGNTLAGIGGGIVGGTTGAAAAANVNLYNQWRDSGSTDIDTLERAAGISDGGKRTSTLERILQGIALAANAVLGMEGGPPPGASPSAVLVNSAAGALPAQALAGQGITPSHAIFNDGGGETTNSEATSPVGVSGSPMVVPRGTNVPTTINGVDYTGHAIDQMQGRGIPPSVVKNTIQNGNTFPTRTGTTGYYDSVNNVRVITNSNTGRVVAVIPGVPGK